MKKDGVIIHIDGDDSGFKKSLSGIGNVAKKGFAAVAKGIAAASAGLTALTAAAVKSYGEYEQLIGGVDTLFESSSKKVQENAAKAYRTAGLSANEYMETATSFAASLKQSFDDTAEGVSAAADAADMAVIDMADNANKMGTAMENIQIAYQGFAKQNYTMLDNLKLGYGGTKEEMQRLLADAQKISGIKYDISNLADVYNAIHVIQTELGITGTTAEEASTTIIGSANMMKAAWSNLMTGIADENANMEALVDNLSDSMTAFAENLMPVIETAINGLGDFAQESAGTMMTTLVKGIASAVPDLGEAAIDAVMALVEGIADNSEPVGEATGEIVGTMVKKLIASIPILIDAASKLISGLAKGLGDALPILKPVTGLIEFLGDSIDGLIPPVDKAAVALENLNASYDEAMQKAEKAGDTYLEEADKISTLKDSLYQMERQLKNGTLSQEEADRVQGEFKETASELETLIPGITSLLYDETGAIDIQRDSVDSLAASYIELATAKAIAEQYAAKIAATSTALQEAKEIKDAAIENYQTQKKIEDEIGYAADSEGFRSEAEANAFDTMTAASRNVAFLESDLKGLKEEAETSQKEVSKLFEEIPGAAEKAGDKVKETVVETAGATTGVAKKTTDTLKEEFNKQLKNLKYAHDTGEKSDAEYYKELGELRNKYFETGSEEWNQYTTEIYNWQKSVLTKVKEDSIAAVEEFQKAKEEIVSGLDDDVADTYQTVNIQDGENTLSYTKLADIGAENKKLEEYNGMLDKLFERTGGELPDYVMQQLKSMNVDEGINYVSAMLRASDNDFEAYITGLEEKAERQGLIADKLMTEDAEEFAKKVAEIYGTIPEGFFDIGEDSATAFSEGFGARLAADLKGIMDSMMANFHSTFTPAIMTAGVPGAGTVNHNSYTYNLQPSGESVYAQRKAIEDQNTYNSMIGEG